MPLAGVQEGCEVPAMISLVVDPSSSGMSWDTFRRTAPSYSIAADGYVSDGPLYDPSGPYLCMNHHDGVDRLATRSTCAQMLMSIRQGLFKRFRDKDGPRANIVVGDCDEDVCTTWYEAENHHLVEHTMNPRLNRLVAAEDALDCTAGAYPFPADLPFLQELAWVFSPYRSFRLSGGLYRQKADEYRGVITDVCLRIGKHVVGDGGRIPLDTRYEVLAQKRGYAVVREVGAHARTGMFSDGIQAYISVTDLPNGKLQCVIGRLSPFVFVDTSKLAARFNQAEGIVARGWGGGNNIIGSPLNVGTSLKLPEITEITDEVLRQETGVGA